MVKIVFEVTAEFERDFKRLNKKYVSLAEDLKAFKNEFASNPNVGIAIGSNFKKIRLTVKSKGKGKSGGGRLIIYDVVAEVNPKKVILICMYDKSETDSISIAEIKRIFKQNGF